MSMAAPELIAAGLVKRDGASGLGLSGEGWLGREIGIVLWLQRTIVTGSRGKMSDASRLPDTMVMGDEQASTSEIALDVISVSVLRCWLLVRAPISCPLQLIWMD